MRVPGFRSRNLGREPLEVVRQQEERQDRRLRDVGLEHVALDERRLVGDAGLRRVALRELDHVRVEFHAERPRAALGRGDDVAPVAGAEVDDVVVGVTFAMSSIFSTSSSGVGTQTTSFPGWLRRGVRKGLALVGAGAGA